MTHFVNQAKSLPPEICVSLRHTEKESGCAGRRGSVKRTDVPFSKGLTVRTSENQSG